MREWQRYRSIPREYESFGEIFLQWDKLAPHLERLAELDAEFAATLRMYNIMMQQTAELWELLRAWEAGRGRVH